jgi:hypothetical protein
MGLRRSIVIPEKIEQKNALKRAGFSWGAFGPFLEKKRGIWA